MKALLLKIKLFIMKLFASVETFIPIGIEVVNKLKIFIDSPTADIITAIIPGTVDDNVKIWLRAWLPIILGKFGGLETIIKLPVDAQNFIYLGIATEINKGIVNDLTKETLSLPQAVIATQYKHDETALI